MLTSLNDYLLPTVRYDDPTADPDKSYQSVGGRIYIELVYFRHEDVQYNQLTPIERSYLDAWKLRNHPFVRFDGHILSYRAIQDVWWIILTPYKVPIPNGTIWELDVGGGRTRTMPREISNEVTLNVARNLPPNSF